MVHNTSMCFLKRGNTKGTNFSKKMCLMFIMYVCFVLYIHLLENLWFDGLYAEHLGNRLKFVFGLDTILYG